VGKRIRGKASGKGGKTKSAQQRMRITKKGVAKKKLYSRPYRRGASVTANTQGKFRRRNIFWRKPEAQRSPLHTFSTTSPGGGGRKRKRERDNKAPGDTVRRPRKGGINQAREEDGPRKRGTLQSVEEKPGGVAKYAYHHPTAQNGRKTL